MGKDFQYIWNVSGAMKQPARKQTTNRVISNVKLEMNACFIMTDPHVLSVMGCGFGGVRKEAHEVFWGRDDPAGSS